MTSGLRDRGSFPQRVVVEAVAAAAVVLVATAAFGFVADGDDGPTATTSTSSTSSTSTTSSAPPDASIGSTTSTSAATTPTSAAATKLRVAPQSIIVTTAERSTSVRVSFTLDPAAVVVPKDAQWTVTIGELDTVMTGTAFETSPCGKALTEAKDAWVAGTTGVTLDVPAGAGGLIGRWDAEDGVALKGTQSSSAASDLVERLVGVFEGECE